ncbi:MAG: DUF1552 domain-containing protein [Polyangiaceae bacterium]|nr:DUF1552 domain-containing protein [Polyangiaceae bacterium]
MTHSRNLTRRALLASLGAGSALYGLFTSMESAAQGSTAKRLLVLAHPIGSVRPSWLPVTTAGNLTLSPILAPFEPVKRNMVVLDGLDLVGDGGGGLHESGTVLIGTGSPTIAKQQGAGGSDDCAPTAPSMDQILLNKSPFLGGRPVGSLQLAADNRVEDQGISCAVLSYRSPTDYLYPELDPNKVYQQVFGNVMPGGPSPSNMAALARARARQQSVLDFSKRDLARLEQAAPASEKVKIDAFATAIRELETTFDAQANPGGSGSACQPGMAPAPFTPNVSESHGAVGQALLAIIRTAFACDLTRVASFLWAPGTSVVTFSGLFPGMETVAHHPHSHAGDRAIPELTAIDTWYSEQTSLFLQSLAQTPDGTGTLLDNTLVLYVTEVARANHSFEQLPIVVFGGPGVGIRQAGRMVQYQPRPFNDLWLAVANQFGVPMASLGSAQQWSGPLPNLFA